MDILLAILKLKKLLGRFKKKNDKKLTNELIEKISLYKMSYFPEAYSWSQKKIKIESDLSNYATKSDLENTTDLDTSNFAKKVELASLKPDADELYVDKL